MRSILVLCFTMACTSQPDDRGGAPAPSCTDVVFYADADDDGHGDPGATITACAAPAGFGTTSDDCDDTNAAIHPAAPELCNTLDDDCDGSIDVGASDETVWYADADGDGFGSTTALASCVMPAGYASSTGDCDDGDADVRPDSAEICDGVDDDCDGLVDALDPDLVDGATWYGDVDNDGYGDPANSVVACDCPVGFVSNRDDCDDAALVVHPFTIEICDGVDNDCDGLTDDDDDSVFGTLLYYADVDGDGLGDRISTTTACVVPKAYVAVDGDCDDTDPAVGGPLLYYTDYDGDGYGVTGAGVLTCTPDADQVLLDGDCKSTDPDVSPGATEICGGGDDNCNGLREEDDPGLVATVWSRDADGDGYGDDTDTIASCDGASGYVEVGGDCDDGDLDVNPGAPEYCDSLDNDCDGATDETVVYVDWYADADGDGFGNRDDVTNDCARPSGYVLDTKDCDDAAATTYPGANEVCLNAADDDCDRHVDNCTLDMRGVGSVIEAYDATQDLRAVAVADLDGDGVSDLLLGSHYAASDDGEAYVVLGPVSADVSVEDGIIFSSTTEYAYLGSAVGAGDVDDDGVGDVLLAALYGPQTYLFLGPTTASHDDADADTWFDREATDLLVMPDVDGDGGSDVLMLLSRNAYVLAGALTGGVDVAADATYELAQPTRMTMTDLADVGDANGDGAEDLALCGFDSAANLGAVYVVEGGAPPGAYDVALDAVATIGGGDLFGTSMAGVDYDNDGAADLLVTTWMTPVASGGYTAVVSGFLGPLSGTLTEADAFVRWEVPLYGGSAVAGGDIDGDKNPDVLIGNNWDPNDGVGRVYIQLGLASGVLSTEGMMTLEGNRYDYFGDGVTLVPDWDGDDAAEIAIGVAEIGATDVGDRNGFAGLYLVGLADLAP